jgi:hypothetical protein
MVAVPQLAAAWGRLMADLGDYRENANRCLLMANQATDPSLRSILFQLAKAWVKLAEQQEHKDDLRNQGWTSSNRSQ